MHEVEKELVEATSYKPSKFAKEDRQVHLASLVKAVDKMSADDYDNISDEAADWFNSAVKAIKAKRDVPDFEDEAEAEDEDADTEQDDDAEPIADADASDEDPDNTDVDEEDESADEAEEDAEPETADSDEADAEDEPEAEPEDEDAAVDLDAAADAEDESENEAKEAAAAKKAAKGVKTKGAKKPLAVEDVLPPKPKSKYKRTTGDTPTRYTTGFTNLEMKKNRFGVVEGTKLDDAVKMYNSEGGTNRQQLQQDLGGQYYNILKRFAQDGHRVEKLENGNWRVIHKDDLDKKPAKKAPKK